MNESASITPQQVPKRLCPVCGKPLSSVTTDEYCLSCLLKLAATETDFVESPEKADGHPSPSENAVAEEALSPNCEEIATIFPQFEILGRIGKGGMGTVFKARQPKLNRFVALKILSGKLSQNEHFTERFLREAQILARLNHPNIVAVYDFGETSGCYYLVLEYVEGVNLRQAMREKRFTPEQAIAIIPKICEALQYAHDEGVLHRDIKPENILLGVRGQIKIADFGIGKLTQEDRQRPGDYKPGSPDPSGHLTQTGVVLGTPNYMAPEQMESPEKVDHRADIYSLGVVFYEMLTGEIPRGIFPLPSEKTPVDAEIDQIVLKALKKNRDQRQQSAAELKDEIETSQHASPEPKSPPFFHSLKNEFWNKIGSLKSTMPVWARILVLAIIAYFVITRIVPVNTRGFTMFSSFDPTGLAPFLVPLAPFIMVVLVVAVVMVASVVNNIAKMKYNGGSASLPGIHPSQSPTLFCTHCGNKLEAANVHACPKCGFATRQKRNFCFHCGVKTDPEQILCVQCGSSLPLPSPFPSLGGKKDRLTAGLFALLLGWIGVHKFYLGSWGWGIIYLLFMWTGITLIVGIIEGILLLTMDDMGFDIRYNQTQPSPFRW